MNLQNFCVTYRNPSPKEVFMSAQWVGFSFGASGTWPEASSRVKQQVMNFSSFSNIVTDSDLRWLLDDQSFARDWKQHLSFMSENSRGFGYWLWKPLVLKHLSRLFPDQGIAYFDAGCEFNINWVSKTRMNKYLKDSWREGPSIFGMDHLENVWSKADSIQRIFPEQMTNPTGQVSASVIFLPPGSDREKLMRDWFEFAIEDDYHLLNDSISHLINHSNFIEHRHDQSLLSLLFKKNHYRILRDESHNPKFLPQFATPIWAIRNSGSKSILHDYKKIAQNSWFGL
jgi:hypothetical protein